jgi:hypothetical protein
MINGQIISGYHMELINGNDQKKYVDHPLYCILSENDS